MFTPITPPTVEENTKVINLINVIIVIELLLKNNDNMERIKNTIKPLIAPIINPFSLIILPDIKPPAKVPMFILIIDKVRRVLSDKSIFVAVNAKIIKNISVVIIENTNPKIKGLIKVLFSNKKITPEPLYLKVFESD